MAYACACCIHTPDVRNLSFRARDGTLLHYVTFVDMEFFYFWDKKKKKYIKSNAIPINIVRAISRRKRLKKIIIINK